MARWGTATFTLRAKQERKAVSLSTKTPRCRQVAIRHQNRLFVSVSDTTFI